MYFYAFPLYRSAMKGLTVKSARFSIPTSYDLSQKTNGLAFSRLSESTLPNSNYSGIF